jgi:hypothetical protein
MTKILIEIDLDTVSKEKADNIILGLTTMLKQTSGGFAKKSNPQLAEVITETEQLSVEAPAAKEEAPKAKADAVAIAIAPAPKEKAAVEKTEVSIEDIRAKVSTLVDLHRDIIKFKLQEFKANNVGQLGHEHYADFYKFLLSLEK